MIFRNFSLQGRQAGLWIALAVLTPGQASAQGLGVAPRPLSPRDVPALISRQVAALGDRLWRSGQERVVLAGVFTDAEGDATAQLVLQVPGFCQLELNGAAGKKTIAFDGAAGWTLSGTVDSKAEDVLESLSGDSPEGWFSAVAQGATCWPAGTRVRVNDPGGEMPGPRFMDVYGSLRVVKQRGDRVVRRKMYCFDSETQLLNRVVYRSNSGAGVVETLFEGWERIEGQAVPAVWKRKEKGRVVFTFRRTAAAFSAGVEDGLFGRGNRGSGH
jgi:hypothetical protein